MFEYLHKTEGYRPYKMYFVPRQSKYWGEEKIVKYLKK